MTITKHLKKTILKFMKYPFYAFLFSSLIIFVFFVFYLFFSIPNPLKYSIDIFIGNTNINENIYILSLTEIAVKSIFVFGFLTFYFVKFLEPIVPIEMPNYFIYDEKNKKIIFRYWIMLQSGNYLFDVHLRLLFESKKGMTNGNNALGSSDDFILDDNKLQMIRGVRTITLSKTDKDYPKILVELLEKNPNKNIHIFITATNEKGKKICFTKTYYKKNMLKDCDFVSIRSTTFFKRLYHSNPLQKPFFRYEYFDKVYVPNDNDCKKTNILKQKYPHARKDILTKKEFQVEQYSEGHHLKDLYSQIASRFLNK